MPGAEGAEEGPVIMLVCRAVSLSSTVASGNTDLAFAFLNELKAAKLGDHPLVNPEKTQFSGNIGSDEPPGTFTFSVAAQMKQPLKY